MTGTYRIGTRNFQNIPLRTKEFDNSMGIERSGKEIPILSIDKYHEIDNKNLICNSLELEARKAISNSLDYKGKHEDLEYLIINPKIAILEVSGKIVVSSTVRGVYLLYSQ